MSEHLTENIKLRLDSETLEALRRLAALGDRNVAQEMRRALRKHVLEVSAIGPYNDPSCPPDTEAP